MSASGVCSEALASSPVAVQESWQLEAAVFGVALLCIVALSAMIYKYKLQSPNPIKTSKPEEKKSVEPPSSASEPAAAPGPTTSSLNKATETPRSDPLEGAAPKLDAPDPVVDPKTLQKVQKEFQNCERRGDGLESYPSPDRFGESVPCLPAPGSLDPATLKTIQKQLRNSRNNSKKNKKKSSTKPQQPQQPSQQLSETTSLHSDAQDASNALKDWPGTLENATSFVLKTVEAQKLWIKNPNKRLFTGDWALWTTNRAPSVAAGSLSGGGGGGGGGGSGSGGAAAAANSTLSRKPRASRKAKKKRKAKNAKSIPVMVVGEVVPSLYLVLTPSGERPLVKAANLQLFELQHPLDSKVLSGKSNAYLFPLMAYVQHHSGNLRKLWRNGKLVAAVFSAMQELQAVPDAARAKLLAACNPSLEAVAKMVRTSSSMTVWPIDKVVFAHDTRISKALEHLSCYDKARFLCIIVRLAAQNLARGCCQLTDEDLALVSFSGLDMLSDKKLSLELSSFNPYTCDTGFFERQVQFAHVLDHFDLIEHGSGTGLALAAALALGKAQSIFGVDILHPQYTTAPIIRNVVRSLTGVEFRLVTTPKEGNQAVVDQLDFVVGCVVRISGLNNAEHYNGRYGRVTETETAHGRLRVIVRATEPTQAGDFDPPPLGASGKSVVALAIHRSNLRRPGTAVILASWPDKLLHCPPGTPVVDRTRQRIGVGAVVRALSAEEVDATNSTAPPGAGVRDGISAERYLSCGALQHRYLVAFPDGKKRVVLGKNLEFRGSSTGPDVFESVLKSLAAASFTHDRVILVVVGEHTPVQAPVGWQGGLTGECAVRSRHILAELDIVEDLCSTNIAEVPGCRAMSIAYDLANLEEAIEKGEEAFRRKSR